MRKIAVLGMMLLTLSALGCSKKTEEQAKETQMAPAPATQEAAPAPMQGMESSQPPAAGSSATGEQGNGQEKTQGGQAPSGAE